MNATCGVLVTSKNTFFFFLRQFTKLSHVMSFLAGKEQIIVQDFSSR